MYKQIFTFRASSILFSFLKNIKHGVFLLPANICYIVPLTFIKANVAYEFVDINKETLCVEEDLVINKIAQKPDYYIGVFFNHTYGTEYNPAIFFRKLRELNERLLIVQDKCLCRPSLESPENFDADLILHSTGYSKYLDLGFGGYGFIRSDFPYRLHKTGYDQPIEHEVDKKLKRYIETNTCINKTIAKEKWLNTNELPTTIHDYIEKISNSLPIIDEHKSIINNIYRTEFPKEIQFPTCFQSWRFNIIIKNKKYYLKKIFENGLFASSHYPDLAKHFDDTRCVNAKDLHANVINLFNDKYITVAQASELSHIIRDLSTS